MKKIIFLFILLLMMADLSMVWGQPTRYNYIKSPPKFGYGIKAGVNVAGQSSSIGGLNIDVKNILGINAGGYCNYFPFDLLGVQGEIMVSGKGAHWKDFYDDKKDLITYIDIPLLVKFQPAGFINIHAGVQAGFRIRATQKDLETGDKIDIKDFYNFSDYGLVGGVEADLPNKINLSVRYIYGLTAATTDVQYVDPWKNYVFQFSLGYRFSGR